MLTNTRNVRIEWGDCDPAGIVYYPRYFEFFDAGTAALFERALGMNKRQFLRTYDLVGYPMVDTRARFLMPSRYGDDVAIETTITEFRKSSFDVRHRLLNAGALAVEGFETRVCVGRDSADPEKIKARAVPREVVERFLQA